MRALDDAVPFGIDRLAFLLRETPPQDEDQPGFLPVEQVDDGVGEALPGNGRRVGVGLSLVDRHRRVQHQDALARPALEVAVLGGLEPWDVRRQLLVHVDQGGRRRGRRLHREAEAVGLAGADVGVLADQHDADLIEGRQVEGGEDLLDRRVDGDLALSSGGQKGADLVEIRRSQLRRQKLPPGRLLQAGGEQIVGEVNAGGWRRNIFPSAFGGR